AFLSLLLGTAHSRQGQTEVAVKYYRYAVASFVEIGDTVWAITSLDSLGDVILVLGQREDALNSYLDAFAFGLAVVKNGFELEKKSDREFAIALVSKIVMTATELGKYEQAIKVLD